MSGCNQNFPYFPNISQYIRTVFANTESYAQIDSCLDQYPSKLNSENKNGGWFYWKGGSNGDLSIKVMYVLKSVRSCSSDPQWSP